MSAWVGKSPTYAGWGYVGILILGYALAGWLFAAYAVPGFVWALTLMVIVHLARVGPDAIALALTWVVALIWTAAFIGAKPQHLMWMSGPTWGLSLLLLWALALVLVLLLAFVGPVVPFLDGRRRGQLYPLVGLLWSSLGLGALFYTGGGFHWGS